jgi:hypothetical protein
MSTSTSTPPAASEPPSTTPTASPTFGLPSDFVVPNGWIESVSRFDSSAGVSVESSDDPRFTSFVWIAEGCCDAGLDAPFGSPNFPDSDDASDLEDGLYLASIESWNPNEPEWATIDVHRVVDCGSEEAADTYYCPVYEFAPGRFEAMETSRQFRLRLDGDLTVMMAAALEPVDGDEYYTNYSWVAQGPDFIEFLSELHTAYNTLITEPFRSGATYADVAVNLDTDERFREVSLDGWMPFGIWQAPNGPALAYDKPDSLVPSCFDPEECIDRGDPQTTPRSFESLIGTRAGLHVDGGRLAFFLLGSTLGG